MIKKSEMDHLAHHIISRFGLGNLKITDYIYYLLFMSVPLATAAVLIYAGPVWLYIVMAVVSAAVVFLVRSIVAAVFEIRLSYKPWFTGLIFSFIATIIVSVIAGVAVPIPVMNVSEYKRANTLRGLKRGEIKNKDKWETSMFSFIAILAFAQLFISLGGKSTQPLFYSGILLILYVLVDILPLHRFNGSFMAYHNTILYFIESGFITLMLVLSYISAASSLVLFIIFVLANLTAYKIKLW
ncbi:MAG: hypothetical protein M1433_03270 [Candidatus Parvarchaeota archaeon]|nr:hypothetical protein [Candidatus Parvarchaeota archaeon]